MDDRDKKFVTTDTIAERFLVQPQTVRKNLCLRGDFYGVIPVKLPSGRLLWPDVGPLDLQVRAARRGR